MEVGGVYLRCLDTNLHQYIGQLWQALPRTHQADSNLFSLFSTLCRLSPQGRGEALLFYSGLLRKVCWAYWSVSGEFEDYRYDSDFEDSKKAAEEFWKKFSKKKRESTKKPRQPQAPAGTGNPAEGSEIHARTEDRADEDGEDPASSVLQTPFVECLPEYLTETESMRAALFQKFVEEVLECTEEGEDELQRSYGSPGSAPRVIRSKDGDDDDKLEGRRRRKQMSENNHGNSDKHHKDKENLKDQEIQKLKEDLAKSEAARLKAEGTQSSLAPTQEQPAAN
ncbi:MEGF10 [Symbiodinium sp. CCMP2456]|nr:MEGF10 [Symbiodinium sp. CCMP2456]